MNSSGGVRCGIVFFGAERFVEGRDGVADILLALVPQKQNLQSALAGAMACRHGLEPRHFDRGHRGVEAFVAGRAARASLGLFPIVGGENAEDDRHAGIEPSLLQSARRFSGHVIEVRRVAANHRAQRDDGVKAAALGQLFCREGQLKSSGNVEDLLAFRAALW